jgi:hypothetical protein
MMDIGALISTIEEHDEVELPVLRNFTAIVDTYRKRQQRKRKIATKGELEMVAAIYDLLKSSLYYHYGQNNNLCQQLLNKAITWIEETYAIDVFYTNV